MTRKKVVFWEGILIFSRIVTGLHRTVEFLLDLASSTIKITISNNSGSFLPIFSQQIQKPNLRLTFGPSEDTFITFLSSRKWNIL